MSIDLRNLWSYKTLSRLIQNESFEPLIGWGIRMALSGTLPIIWGLATGRIGDAVWLTLTAEAVSWVELKGSFAWRVRTLFFGALLSIFFACLGILSANNIWLSVICMFGVGFVATLLKSIGDRASGLAICVYLLFIICNAYPVHNMAEFYDRLTFIVLGAVWPVMVGVVASLLTPAEEPFRRQVALIWRSIGSLVQSIAKTGNDKRSRALMREVYAKEKEVRTTLDSSYQFYSRMAHQVNKENHQQYQLAMVRKVAGLLAVSVTEIGEEMEHITISSLDKSLRLKAAALYAALQEAIGRIAVYVITLKPEERLIVFSEINRMQRLTVLIREYPLPPEERQTLAIKRILQLTDRSAKLMESALQRLESMGKDVPVFKSYSMVKTLFILKPRHLLGNLRVLFNFDTFNARYALRSAIAATIGLFIFKWFKIDHGYWIPFSVMIVIQPYFGATFKKAIDRVVGTLLGGIAGGLLLRLPTGLYLKESILFITFILMVYYVRKNYAVAVFAVTLNLVLLFHLEEAYNNTLMITRALSTVGGAILAVGSGYALFPMWDKKWLPSHLAAAVMCNYEYFISTFYAPVRITNWTRYKRSVESKNSNVFDSFNRYMAEPGKDKSPIYYDLIVYNVRITRNLNFIHIEQDDKRQGEVTPATDVQQKRIDEALMLFNKVVSILPDLHKQADKPAPAIQSPVATPFLLNDAQQTSLEKLLIELKAMERELTAFVNRDNESAV
jgi:uncharacterized membrane protein YccC